MSDAAPKPQRRRRLMQSVVGVLVLAALFGVGWYVRSARFNNWVRSRVIADLEELTGGRVELQSFRWELWHLQVELGGLTIHGREGAGETPYLHADRVLLRAKVISLLRRDFGLRYLQAERPVVHLIIYPDGSTNQPVPKTRHKTSGNGLEDLVDLAINRADINQGVLFLNDQPLPFDLSAKDIGFTLRFARRDQRYDGGLHLGSIETRYRDLLPFASVLDSSFSLWRDRAEFHWIDVVSGASHLKATGEVHGFAVPRVNLRYSGTVDAVDLARIVRQPGVRGGLLDISGQGTFATRAEDLAISDYAFSGKIAIRDLNYAVDGLRVANAAVGADYSVTQEKLKLPHVFASVMGGTAVGEAEVANWTSSSASAGERTQKPGPGLQAGAVRLRLSNLSVSRLAAAIATRSLPLDRLGLSGRADGTIDARWKGAPRNLLASVALGVLPPANPGTGDLPLTAEIRSQFDLPRRQVDVQNFDLATRATHIAGRGLLGPTSGKLSVEMTTTDLGEWQPIMAAFGGPQHLPLELRGRADFNGVVSGSLAAPSISGRVQVSDFTSLIAGSPLFSVPGNASPPPTVPHKVHWDHMTADVEYSPSLLQAHRAVLQHGSAQINLSLTAALHRYQFTASSPFELTASVRNADVPDVLAFAGYDYPVTGTVNFNVHAAGTRTVPQASGSLVVSNARMYGEAVQHLSTDFRFINHEAQFTALEVAHDGATASGTAAYNVATSAFRFQLRGSRFNLARIHRLQSPRLSIGGGLDFTAAGSGTTSAPNIEASLRFRDLVLNGEHVGDLTTDASTSGELMHVKARSTMRDSETIATGTVNLRGDYPASFDVRFNAVDVDPLVRALTTPRVAVTSRITGALMLQGPLRRPRDLTANANITDLSAEIGHIPVRNEGPIRFTVDQQVMHVEQFRLLGADTALNASGSVQLSDSHLLDVVADGRLNLKLLQSLNKELISYGQAVMNVRVNGELSRPLVRGDVDVRNAGLSYIDLPNGLSDINGRLVFNQDRLQIASLAGRTGGGTVNITGFVTYGQTLSFNLAAAGRDIRLRYPQGVSSMVNADLRLTGNMQNALLSGDVTVTKFGINTQFDLAYYLAKAKQPPETPNPDSPLSHLRLDVHVVSTPELQVQTSLAKISGNVDLRLRGTPTRPLVLGRVNIIEGDVSFQGTRYRLDRGDVTFSNPASLTPVLDIQATTTVRDYDITLGFHGPADKLATTYRSDPPLATADIVSLLAFGRTREQNVIQPTQNQNLPETASYAILGQALNAAVSGRMQKIFGVSRIKIDPEAGGPEYNPAGPTVTIEQQVANRLTITYISNLSRANYQTIQAEYNVNRNISVVAVRDWTGVVSFDIRIRQRKR